MQYKDFIKLCFCNIRNSIEVSNVKRIMPIKSKELEILLIDENRLSIISKEYNDVIWAENGYFRCDEIIKSVAKVYHVEYVDNTFRNLLVLRQKLFKVIGIDEGEK